MAQQKARKKSSGLIAGASEPTPQSALEEFAAVADSDLPASIDPDLRVLLLNYECARNDQPMLDNEVPVLWPLSVVIQSLHDHAAVLQSRLQLIEIEDRLTRLLKNRLATRQYLRWSNQTEPHQLCLNAALNRIVRNDPGAVQQVAELKRQLLRGPSISNEAPIRSHDLGSVLSTIEALIEAHPDAGPWMGFFDPIRDDRGEVVHRRWRWGKLSSPAVSINSDGEVERRASVDGADGDAVIAAKLARLGPIDKSILIALFDRGVCESSPLRPTQEDIAKWTGRQFDTTIKTALSSLSKAGLIDNWRHHGRRGGYFLTSEGMALSRVAFGHD